MKGKILNNYVAKNVLAAIGLVTLMLIGLQIFILFVNELDDLGRANFGIVQAATYVVLQAPYQVYLFFPMASLLGSLIGLGIMANNRELVVMRASGMSIGQITKAVLKASILVILIVTALGETFVPKLSSIANDKKLLALSGNQALRTANGVWLRSQNDFINIGVVKPDQDLQNVYQFRFDDNHKLQMARKINKLSYAHGQWIASNVLETTISDTKTKARHIDELIWDVPIKPNLLKIKSNEPDEMTLPTLYKFLQIHKKNHQDVDNYQIAFWHRLLQPITTMVMMVLAIPFIFGPLRSSTMGSKLLAGAVLGFSYHIINRIFGPISQVMQWPVEVAAFMPTIIFAMLGIYLMKRVR